MGLKQKIQEDMREALKKGDRERLSALRMLLAQIKNAEIDKIGELTDEEIYQVITREARKWEEAAEEYEKGGDLERAAKEKRDASIIKGYLPRQLTPQEIEELIKEIIEEVGAKGIQDMGQVMKLIMPKVRGRADGKVVNEMVKAALSS